MLKNYEYRVVYTQFLFMSPLFLPYITDFKKIIEATAEFVCEYWFENLNLESSRKLQARDFTIYL